MYKKGLKIEETGKVGNCDALQLKGRPTLRQSFSTLIAVLIMYHSRPVKFQHNFTRVHKSEI